MRAAALVPLLDTHMGEWRTQIRMQSRRSRRGKWLELLSEIVPKRKRAVFMFNPDALPTSFYVPSFETAAQSLKVDRSLRPFTAPSMAGRRAAAMRLSLGEPRQQLLNRGASTVSTASSLSAGRSSDEPCPRTEPQYSHRRLQSRQWGKLIRISATKRRQLIKSQPVPSRASVAKVGSPHCQAAPTVGAQPADCKASRPHPETGC
jgi:hypothetical protein